MVEREGQSAQRLSERCRALFVQTAGPSLKEGDGLGPRQDIERHLLCPVTPVAETRSNQDPRPRCGQQVGDVIWACNVVVDQEKDRALFSEATQSRLRRLLDIGLFPQGRAKRLGQLRQGGLQAEARLGRAPPDTRIEIAVPEGIFDCECGFPDSAHTLHRGSANLLDGSAHSLGHRRRPAADQDCVEPSELRVTPREAGDARWHADEGSRRGFLGLGLALGRGQNAALALLGVLDAVKILRDIGGEQATQWRVIAAQDDHPPLFEAPSPVRFEACELAAGVRGSFVVFSVQNNEIAGALDRLVHRLNEICCEGNVIVLDDDRTARVGQDIGNLLRHGRNGTAAAEEEIEPALPGHQPLRDG